jgi:Rieske Fe-S protein
MAMMAIAACERQPAGQGGDGAEDPALAAIQAGQGAIVELGGKKVAAYRDEAGALIQLSPACPHAGCDVGWNARESTWDCPCHASRFEPDGTRRSGPATEGLTPLS